MDYKLIQYQILSTNIIRIVWQTVRRITNKILGVKELSFQSSAERANIKFIFPLTFLTRVTDFAEKETTRSLLTTPDGKR